MTATPLIVESRDALAVGLCKNDHERTTPPCQQHVWQANEAITSEVVVTLPEALEAARREGWMAGYGSGCDDTARTAVDPTPCPYGEETP